MGLQGMRREFGKDASESGTRKAGRQNGVVGDNCLTGGNKEGKFISHGLSCSPASYRCLDTKIPRKIKVPINLLKGPLAGV